LSIKELIHQHRFKGSYDPIMRMMETMLHHNIVKGWIDAEYGVLMFNTYDRRYCSHYDEDGYRAAISIKNNDRRKNQKGPMCMSSDAGSTDHDDDVAFNSMVFDRDSEPIRIDNCCTRTISNDENDFLSETLERVDGIAISGFGGSNTMITHQGTIRWTIANDQGA
jgi:hypothetical protein